MYKVDYATLYSNILQNISKIKTTNQVKDAFLKSFYNLNPDIITKTNLKILILNSPCNGFGDVIFASKIAMYLEKWYNAVVTIATANSDCFNKLGIQNKIISLGSKSGVSHCRRFKNLHYRSSTIYDLIFVAPMQSDYSPSLQDVKAIIPYANKFNTYFFSEYNSYDDDEDFDFATGIGGNKYGLLFTKPEYKQCVKTLKNPYAFVYIAETIDNSYDCFMSFVEMVCKKYSKKHLKFDIVIPETIIYFITDYEEDIMDKVSVYYPNIRCIDKNGESFYITQSDKSDNTLTFRGDILPVKYSCITGIIKNSVKDILLTGDQSITDTLSCCSTKNIFYQIAGWKENFAHELAMHLPNKYLLDSRTSCGTIKAIKYRSNCKEFMRKWDFRKLAKPKMDAIIFSAAVKKKDNDMKDLENILNKSRSIGTLKTNILRFLEKY